MDENLSPTVAAVFREAGFRALEAAKHPRLRRDERSFVGELYRQNAVFVTADAEYVDELADSPRRHAGVVFIPQHLLADEKNWFAFMAAHFLLGRCADSAFGFRGRILYAGSDGLRLHYRGEDVLQISWARLGSLAGTSEPEISRRRPRKPR